MSGAKTRATMARLARPLATFALLVAAGCSTAGTDEDERGGVEIIVGDEEKADGASGVELVGFVDHGAPVTGAVGGGPQRLAYLFYAAAGTKVDLEVTRTGSSSSLDSVMLVYGPRDAAGAYPRTIAEDDDAGYGKLSKVAGKTIDTAGYYLVEVKSKTTLTEPKAFRLELKCTSGSCERTAPPAPIGLDIRWSEKSAEMRAAGIQAYAVASARIDELEAAGLPADWGVVMDIDETTLMNVTYQRERAELGTAYSPASWLAWVQREAATPMPGAKAFIEKVRGLGGRVVFVSNRKATGECQPTEDNLAAVGIQYDAILCRTDTSDKNPRFESVIDGTARPGLPALETVLYVGDNIQDFPDLSQDIRTEPESAFEDFGRRFIVIPNPMYGSWEKND